MAFNNVMEESALLDLRSGGYRRLVIRPSKSCDYVTCTRPYEEILRTCSGNFRSNLHKARKKLQGEADVVYESHTQGEALQRGYQAFLELEASGWKGAQGAGTAILLHTDLQKFYQSLLQYAESSGEIVVNLLRVGNRPIAAQYCLRDQDTMYVLKLAYDESQARLAPGNMLLEWLIRQGGGGSHRYVNLVGEPPWFKEWRPEGVPVYNLTFYNATPAGLVLWATTRARQLLGRVVRHAPSRRGLRARTA